MGPRRDTGTPPQRKTPPPRVPVSTTTRPPRDTTLPLHSTTKSTPVTSTLNTRLTRQFENPVLKKSSDEPEDEKSLFSNTVTIVIVSVVIVVAIFIVAIVIVCVVRKQKLNRMRTMSQNNLQFDDVRYIPNMETTNPGGTQSGFSEWGYKAPQVHDIEMLTTPRSPGPMRMGKYSRVYVQPD